MTIAYITKRTGKDNFDRMMVMWKWCERNFGKPDYLTTWDGNFADDTEDWVKFTFYDEAIATWFILMFPEVMAEDQFRWRLFEPLDWKEIVYENSN